MLFSSFWKRGPGPPLWGPGGVLGPLDPPLDPPQMVVSLWWCLMVVSLYFVEGLVNFIDLGKEHS